ncbi:Crp/Fnr family transcriptional regulator [Pediococcus damnosus]|uniref:Crp/Fnr family transcriptional regulator n=3 Tax=Pediococcus damnosus TaxID=51663 RepID=UPI0009C0ACAB|nr:Crp/Fnr family transcriptional regulator [Pediococcus damnosus]
MMIDPRNKGNYERHIAHTHECKVLSKLELAEVFNSMQGKKVRKGQHLFEQYEKRYYTFFLKEGFLKAESVDIYHDSSFMTFICPDMVFPLRGTQTDTSYYYTATALTDAEVVYIPRKLFNKLLCSNNKFQSRILKQFDEAVKENETFLQIRTSSTAKDQVEQNLGLINEWFLDNSRIDDECQITFPITISDLAKFCGLNRKITSAAVKGLVDDGKILYKDKYFFV